MSEGAGMCGWGEETAHQLEFKLVWIVLEPYPKSQCIPCAFKTCWHYILSLGTLQLWKRKKWICIKTWNLGVSMLVFSHLLFTSYFQKLPSKVNEFTAPNILSLGIGAREFVRYYCQRSRITWKYVLNVFQYFSKVFYMWKARNISRVFDIPRLIGWSWHG